MAKTSNDQGKTKQKTVRLTESDEVVLTRLSGRVTERTGERVTVGGVIGMLIEERRNGAQKEVCVLDELDSLVKE